MENIDINYMILDDDESWSDFINHLIKFYYYNY